MKPVIEVGIVHHHQLLLLPPCSQNSPTQHFCKRECFHTCDKSMLEKQTSHLGSKSPARLNSSCKPFFLQRNIRHCSDSTVVRAVLAATAATTGDQSQETQSIEGEEQQKGAAGKQRKTKGSAQLARWARARRIRSAGRYSDLKGNGTVIVKPSESNNLLKEYESEDEEGAARAGESAVFMLSDGTGWTVDHSVHAALGQFEHCLADRGCSVNTHLFSEVNEVDRLMGIIRQAGEEEAIVIFTLADAAMAEAARKACDMLGVPHLDILGPITVALGTHLGVSPLGLPRGALGRKKVLSKQYFKRIEAVEFTIKQDDGALPKNLFLADLILVGVSRTSKTPLSTYMAQMGYKVANVPLVLGIDPPEELFEVDQDKIYALTINPNFLKSIRVTRYRHLGLAGDSRSSYFHLESIRKELEYTRNLFKQNPRWPVIEVTGKAIEESAAAILRIFHERKNKHAMPRISRRY